MELKRLKAWLWLGVPRQANGLGQSNLLSGVSARLEHCNTGCIKHGFLLIHVRQR
jgi:hypothetical protein